MPKCEKCPREVDARQTVCRYHRAEQQAKRAGVAEEVMGLGGKVLPILLMFIPVFRGRVRAK
jgi:hypothetical protein